MHTMQKVVWVRNFLISISLLVPFALVSQIDSHYWSHQYGARGLLLNGAVIASPDGETSIFYNPGAIALDNNLGFAFSFISPTYSNLSVRNFIGNDNRIDVDGLSYSPGFAGIRFKPFKKYDRIVAGVALFKRYRTSISFSDRVVDEVNDLGILLFRADLDFNRSLSEDWASFAIAIKINENVGFGLTQISAWHGENLTFNFKKEIVQSDSPDQIAQSWRAEFGYGFKTQSGFITKLGMNLRFDKIDLGLTVTTPTYLVLRKSAGYKLEDHRIDRLNSVWTSESNRSGTPLLNYKSPTSIALGIDVALNNTKLSLGSEYFFEIGKYVLFEETDDPFDGISSGNADIDISIKSQNSAVLNVALGIEHKMSERKTLYSGFRTDFSQNNLLSLNQDTQYKGYVGNIFHLSGGARFFFEKNHFSIGVDLGYGSTNGGPQLVDLSNITPNNLFTFSGNQNVNSRFYSVMLFLTYDFIFKRRSK